MKINIKNQNNNTLLYGLVKDVIIQENKDKSQRIKLILTTNTENGTQDITCYGFMPKNYKGDGPYVHLQKQEPVMLECSLKFNTYTGLTVQIEKVFFGQNLPQQKSEMIEYQNQIMNPDIQTSTNKSTVMLDNVPDFNEDLMF